MAAQTKGRKRYINRELSWLEFNQRILDLANDEATPLLERARFLAITGSNLDEFFMVRVGGLQMLAGQGSEKRDPAGMTPAEQLEAISQRTHLMMTDQSRCHRTVEQALAREGIRRVHAESLSESQRAHCEEVFEREVYPVLSPIAFEQDGARSLLSNRMLYVAVRLKDSAEGDGPKLAVLPLASNLSRIIALPVESRGHEYILLEDLVTLYASRFFPGERILECAPFRITRNADLSVREDLAGDLLAEMEAVLDARRRGHCVRLEIGSRARRVMERALMRVIGASPSSVYRIDGPIDLTYMSGLCDLGGYEQLLFESWKPQLPPELATSESMFDIVARHPVLIYQPFDSFEPVVRFLNEAADDPDVLAIKQVLYRTSSRSPVTAALMRAAEKGKYVTALVELKARFDEARNIEWAQELEDSGVQVIYGVKKLKTHTKICLVVRREPGGLRRYMHFGTGNYNEKTARLYTDVSYLTTDEDLGADASAFFNAISGYSQPQTYLKLEAAPTGLRDRIIELIRGEVEHCRQGHEAGIKAKMNSLVDPAVIKELYTASQAGVRIDLNIRGICCLRPGVPGLSENIRVVSIVDRFLEHSRIFCFHARGERQVFFSSADWMPRNFDRRLELLVPATDPASRDRLIAVLDTCLSDNVNAWRLRPDGSHERLSAPDKRSRLRSQEVLYKRSREMVEEANRARPTMFEPHRPSGKD
ncbi:MAG: polyphosphate kinase 1 [Chitinivibrionales bacterium]|nr:polyphosphate kinase 1 [Chitinivibrionales bacterium]